MYLPLYGKIRLPEKANESLEVAVVAPLWESPATPAVFEQEAWLQR